jgi:phosphopantothenoylcysteine decarboxylase/phosphopantothenate--cysteine ligase
MGADTVLVTGPSAERDPPGVAVVHIESAQAMLDACRHALPVDMAVCAAAVADWRPARVAARKVKKNGKPPAIELAENPDILATLSASGNARPRLVVGFAAETDDLERNARAKLAKKGCDWIVANDVSPGTGAMGGEFNTVKLVTEAGIEDWPKLPKSEVARRLAHRIAAFFEAGP